MTRLLLILYITLLYIEFGSQQESDCNDILQKAKRITANLGLRIPECDPYVIWHRVGYLDMTQPGSTCPEGWTETLVDSKRACGRSRGGSWTCDPVIFNVPWPYIYICGRIKGYFRGFPKAFKAYQDFSSFLDFNYPYIDGVSLSRLENNMREPAWTLTASSHFETKEKNKCPQNYTRLTLPDFVNSTEKIYYYCDVSPKVGYKLKYTGPDPNRPINEWDSTNPLWYDLQGKEGKTGGYFTKNYGSLTTGDLEARICLRKNNNKYYGNNVAIEQLELYISNTIV